LSLQKVGEARGVFHKKSWTFVQVGQDFASILAQKSSFVKLFAWPFPVYPAGGCIPVRLGCSVGEHSHSTHPRSVRKRVVMVVLDVIK